MNDSNILLLAGRFEVRGSSAYTLRLARHLEERGFTIRVVCADAGAVPAAQRAQLPIQEYGYLDVPVCGRIVREFLVRELSNDVPDLIHIQSRSMLSCGTQLARRLQVPYLLTVHDYLEARERMRLDAIWGRRVIAVSDSVKSELLTRTALPEKSVNVIQSGVDVPEATDAPPILDPGRLPVVGTATPLEERKGVPFFLQAAQKVLETHSGVEFLVSGTGPDEGYLRGLAHELGITEKVTFVTKLFDYSTSLNAIDIFCLPSLQQGLGTIMFEAMALGKPVIASAVGGVNSVIRDEQNGLVVPPSDSGRLAERIVELLDDPVRARAIGDAGRRMIQNDFNVDRMVTETAELYEEILEAERAEHHETAHS